MQVETNLFTMGGIILGGDANRTYYVPVSLDGKLGATVTGYVGSVGCCVEFALLDNSSFSKWMADPSGNLGLPILLVDSKVVASQTAKGEFSFNVNADKDVVLVFVNTDYPQPADFKVHANLDLHFVSVTELYGLVGGSALMAVGLLRIILSTRRRP